MSKILIIRFSALGDVAMTVPVVASFALQYPEHELVVLSNKNFKPLFDQLAPNIRFIGADLKNLHKGILGLGHLFYLLRKEKFDYIADLHGVLRSHYFRLRFAVLGIKVAKIDKGRLEKSRLVRRKNKVLKPLQSSFSRYAEVFTKLGFDFDFSIDPQLHFNRNQVIHDFEKHPNETWIGIAPFAKHEGKIYPLALMEKVISHFSMQQNINMLIFGGGNTEQIIVEGWVKKYPHLISVVNRYRLEDELTLMSKLDVMLSMDSANMHLASLVGVTVVSVWGATHPYAGFMGWNQSIDNAVQVDLYCRPCSIYGNKPCYRGDYACMNLIEPKQIINKIDNIIRIK